MASILSQRVLLEIRKIAQSRVALPKRHAEAANRINQFKADLAAAPVEQGVRDRLQENLRRTLHRAATSHELTGEENSVYAEALDVLIAHAR